MNKYKNLRITDLNTLSHVISIPQIALPSHRPWRHAIYFPAPPSEVYDHSSNLIHFIPLDLSTLFEPEILQKTSFLRWTHRPSCSLLDLLPEIYNRICQYRMSIYRPKHHKASSGTFFGESRLWKYSLDPYRDKEIRKIDSTFPNTFRWGECWETSQLSFYTRETSLEKWCKNYPP
jgi:hypothetical protein